MYFTVNFSHNKILSRKQETLQDVFIHSSGRVWSSIQAFGRKRISCIYSNHAKLADLMQ